MCMDTSFTPAQEPEEYLEARLVATLSSACTIPVEGALTPATIGVVKNLTADTFVGVKVDQSSQDGDYAYRAPMSYSATITVHYARCDDATGGAFRDECRIVRAVLMNLIGDGCLALNGESFACDAFVMNATNTDYVDGDNPTDTKSYAATIQGRITQTTPNTTEA